MTLYESLAAPGRPVADPESRREKIGGHDVTVIHRGGGCVSFWWEQSGLALRLINAYDPPGTLRYSCEEMRQIVRQVR